MDRASIDVQSVLDPTSRAVPTADGCLLWTGALSDGGYGHLGVKRAGVSTTFKVHRLAYERHVGPIPTGAHLDHLCHTRDRSCPGGPCRHRRCVNPAHLEAVAQAENNERTRDRKVACPSGHAARRRHPDGRVYCVTCKSNYDRARHAARVAARAGRATP